ELQQRALGASTWISISTVGPPFQAAFNTTGLTDGTYELRAIATDQAAHTGTSPIRTVLVDNTIPTASLTKPQAGKTIGGSAAKLRATASDGGSGVQSVEYQYAQTGNNTWTTIMTSTTTPFDAAWNTTSVASGDY